MAKSNDTALEQTKFEDVTRILGEIGDNIFHTYYPAYYGNNDIDKIANQRDFLKGFELFCLPEFKFELSENEDVNSYFTKKLKRVFIAAHAMNCSVCYGITSWNSKIDLFIGFSKTNNKSADLIQILKGLIPGVKTNKFTLDSNIDCEDVYGGMATGVLDANRSSGFDDNELSSMMRSLKNENYTFMVLCNPVSIDKMNEKLQNAFKLHDQCSAISKYTVGKQESKADGTARTNTETDTDFSAITGGVGIEVVSAAYTSGSSHSTSISDTVSKTITEGKSLSHEIQNSWALDFMSMLSNLISRYKLGRNYGMWNMSVTFSSDKENVTNILQSGIYGMLYSENEANLQPFVYRSTFKTLNTKMIPVLVPKKFLKNTSDSFGTIVSSDEISGICKIPTGKVIGVDVQENKLFPLNYLCNDKIKKIGNVCEYNEPLSNVQFGLSEEDLNKHTFVCGITGCGKTNTVKNILKNLDKHFMVIEPAKKEYRNLDKEKIIYTIGRPELNCLQINPFYIMQGINPQQHIDLLKDLFSASFAFYGPMPFILEECLHNVYVKKGWDLTLGIHPYFFSKNNPEKMFDKQELSKFYNNPVHKFLFPTMEDLKSEVDSFVEKLNYENDVKGNIRSAINARINSLCVGSKGFIFNTYDIPSFEELFEKNNIVLELEGLSDDSDKAFALGLLLILINEYRQIVFESKDVKGLQHILVIEEAHRLLTNVSTAQNAELGNPKGKAVEHFTNMLAEMRSYGQGVIIAEQIPTKLAPEVIKNSSNKIIHRIVARDDQSVISNTIGLEVDDILTLGQQKTGYALCHREGMSEPVLVKIDSINEKSKKDDEILYKDKLMQKLRKINETILNHSFHKEFESFAFKILLALMKKDGNELLEVELSKIVTWIKTKIEQNLQTYIFSVDDNSVCIKNVLSIFMIKYLAQGVLSIEKLPEQELFQTINDIVMEPSTITVEKFYNDISKLYKRDARNYVIEKLSMVVLNDKIGLRKSNNINELRDYIQRTYLIEKDDLFVNQIIASLKGGTVIE